MSLLDAVTLATSDEFKQLLAAQLVRSAINVYTEDESTADHTARAQLAVRVLRNPLDHGILTSFAWAVSSNDTVASAWTAGDKEGVASDLAFVVSSVWNAVADADGVTNPTA